MLMLMERLTAQQRVVIALASEAEVMDHDETFALSVRSVLYIVEDTFQWIGDNAYLPRAAQAVVVACDATRASSAIIAQTATATIEMCMRVFGMLSQVHF